MIEQITGRYQVRDVIGSGGMGTVYVAYDRLTQREVALKRVKQTLAHLADPDTHEARDVGLILAREFRVLASLRHPHIVQVLDYGFDAQQFPYFTMEYLRDALPLNHPKLDLSTERTLDITVEILQALRYLHRHGLVHRDLKPANIMLLPNGPVKLLDFGLTVRPEQSEDVTGTLTYMSPEAFRGEVIDKQSDLHALGIIVYQLIVGEHPYTADNMSDIIYRIVTEAPTMHPFAQRLGEPMADLVEKMLEKDPAQRPSSAEEVLAQMQAIRGKPFTLEDKKTRERILTTASFVGRKEELAQMEEAIANVRSGVGSAWIIGGEQGVGKTRLLDEVRIRALVSGVRVVRATAIDEERGTLALWGDVVRELALHFKIPPRDRRMLRRIVRDLPAVGESEAGLSAGDPIEQGSLNEITGAFLRLCDQITEPTALLLDDVEKLGVGVNVLRELSERTHTCPLLIVATYHRDDAPYFHGKVGSMQPLMLDRLSREEMRQLSQNILGEQSPNLDVVVDTLHNESEGNVFFIIEMLRYLADNAGALNRIGEQPLPENLFVDGIREVAQRRIERVPFDLQPMFRLAAVAGRKVNLNVLTYVDPELNLDEWLAAGIDASLIDAEDGTWVFAHDKMRDGILAGLDPREAPKLHALVAEALTHIHEGSIWQQGKIAEHWLASDRPEKALAPTLEYVTHTLVDKGTSEYTDDLIARTIEATGDDIGEERLQLLRLASEIAHQRGEMRKAIQHYETIATEAASIGNDSYAQYAKSALQVLRNELG